MYEFIRNCGRHPFATGLFALLSAAGFLISIVGFGIDRQDASQSTELANQTQTIIDKNSEDSAERGIQISAAIAAESRAAEQRARRIESALKRVTEAEPAPDIVGGWDNDKAWTLVMSKVGNSRPIACEKSFRPCKTINHIPMGSYHLLFKESQSIVLALATTSPEISCHACQASISIFEFKKMDRGWNLVISDLYIISAGDYGEVDTVNVSVRAIGNEVYGVFAESTHMYMGLISKITKIYCKLGDNYKEIFDWHTLLNFIGDDTFDTNWTAKIEIVDGVTGIFDMAVEVLDHNKNDEIVEMTRFQFDGNLYQPDKHPEYLSGDKGG